MSDPREDFQGTGKLNSWGCTRVSLSAVETVHVRLRAEFGPKVSNFPVDGHGYPH